MKEEISEGKLRAVSCLKGGLIEEMEDQASMILEQSGTVASLQIQLEELSIKNQHLEGKNRFASLCSRFPIQSIVLFVPLFIIFSYSDG